MQKVAKTNFAAAWSAAEGGAGHHAEDTYALSTVNTIQGLFMIWSV